ncbi:DUF4352 domain-containing protein [Microlunatus parietis]|uniref:DUF4352 domain-containing protein n=1 Tax=Microlunatus parietis TaxID=682979 RepID=A0A7Y9IDA4_9ACTN|nr:DUF4352 domain-containing protein [Microlunatus parietis]NYE74620.1 hypothetical protein [Microlunatus parietis]
MRKTIVAALCTILAVAGCARPDLTTKEGIANAIECTNQRQEASVLGVVLACEVDEAQFGIVDWSQELEQAYTGMTSFAGGAYARVGNFLVSSNNLLAAKKAFETLGVKGVYGTKDNNGSESTQPTEEGKPNPEDTESQPPVVEGEPSTNPTEEPTKEQEDEVEFGETIVTELGNTLKVTGIRYETIDEDCYCGEQGTFYVVFTVKATNNSDESLKDFYITGEAAYGEDGEVAEQVYDSDLKEFSGTLRPGKSATGEFGYVIPKKQTGDVQLQVSVLWDSFLFYGNAKEAKH